MKNIYFVRVLSTTKPMLNIYIPVLVKQEPIQPERYEQVKIYLCILFINKLRRGYFIVLTTG